MSKREKREQKSIPFIKLSKIVAPVGLIFLLVLWIMSFSRGGFNVGIDFSAGLSMNVFLEGIGTTQEVLDALTGIDGVTVVDVDDRGFFRISVPEDDSENFQQVMEARILESLQAVFPSMELLSSEFVGSSFSQETINGAIQAIIGSVILILFYLWIRFKRIGFSLATLLGTVHDVLFVMAFIGAFQLEVSSATVAAVLAILAYSLNDSIVIFDRIRESFNNQRFGTNLEDIINGSLTQTLTRTILTTVTTLVAIIPLIFFATGAVQLFAVKMLVGVMIGGYSSLFIASLIYYLASNARQKREPKKIKAKGEVV